MDISELYFIFLFYLFIIIPPPPPEFSSKEI